MRGSRVEVRSYALRLLHYRSRSRKEMFEKLKRKGFNDEEINNTLQFLEDAGLIKDEVLAVELLRNAVEKRYLGKRGIEMFLSRRGIARELINETLSAHTREMEVETALRLVEKKLKSLKKYPKDVISRRLWGMLQRRGFSSGTINMAVKSIKL